MRPTLSLTAAAVASLVVLPPLRSGDVPTPAGQDDTGPSPHTIVRGDSNGDGHTDLGDSVHLLQYLFLGGMKPPCLKASDANDDGRLDLTDPIVSLGFLVLGGPPPSLSFGACTVDETPDALSCEEWADCSVSGV